MSAEKTLNLDDALRAFYREEESARSRGERENAPSIPRLVDGLAANDFSESEKTRIAASNWAQMIVAGLWEEDRPSIGHYIDYHQGDHTFGGAIKRLTDNDPWEERRLQDAQGLIAGTADVAVPEDCFAPAASGQKEPFAYQRRIDDLTVIVRFEGDELSPLIVAVRSTNPGHEGMIPSVLLEEVDDSGKRLEISGKRLEINDLPPFSKRTLVGATEPILESSWLSPGTFYEAMTEFPVKKFIASVCLSEAEE